MNTDWIVGCVVYSGLDTKLMQNQNSGRFKQSYLERESNKTVIKMLLFHMMMCVVVAVCTVNWNNENRDPAFYLQLQQENDVRRGVLAFFKTISLNSTFIPIALLVAIELVKLT